MWEVVCRIILLVISLYFLLCEIQFRRAVLGTSSGASVSISTRTSDVRQTYNMTQLLRLICLTSLIVVLILNLCITSSIDSIPVCRTLICVLGLARILCFICAISCACGTYFVLQIEKRKREIPWTAYYGTQLALLLLFIACSIQIIMQTIHADLHECVIFGDHEEDIWNAIFIVYVTMFLSICFLYIYELILIRKGAQAARCEIMSFIWRNLLGNLLIIISDLSFVIWSIKLLDWNIFMNYVLLLLSSGHQFDVLFILLPNKQGNGSPEENQQDVDQWVAHNIEQVDNAWNAAIPSWLKQTPKMLDSDDLAKKAQSEIQAIQLVSGMDNPHVEVRTIDGQALIGTRSSLDMLLDSFSESTSEPDDFEKTGDLKEYPILNDNELDLDLDNDDPDFFFERRFSMSMSKKMAINGKVEESSESTDMVQTEPTSASYFWQDPDLIADINSGTRMSTVIDPELLKQSQNFVRHRQQSSTSISRALNDCEGSDELNMETAINTMRNSLSSIPTARSRNSFKDRSVTPDHPTLTIGLSSTSSGTAFRRSSSTFDLTKMNTKRNSLMAKSSQQVGSFFDAARAQFPDTAMELGRPDSQTSQSSTKAKYYDGTEVVFLDEFPKITRRPSVTFGETQTAVLYE